MRKGLAFILSSMLISGSFAACSDSSSSSSAPQTEASSQVEYTITMPPETTAAETSAPAEGETTAAPETTSGTKTTAAAQTEPTAEEKEPQPEDLKGGEIAGLWTTGEVKSSIAMDFSQDGVFRLYTEVTPVLDFASGTVLLNDLLELDISFNGTVLIASYQDAQKIVMERVSGETSSGDIDGTYKVTGGDMKESFFAGQEENAAVIIKDGRTYASSGDIYSYTTAGNKLIITNQDAARQTGSTETSYGIEDGVLTIISADGQIRVLKKLV